MLPTAPENPALRRPPVIGAPTSLGLDTPPPPTRLVHVALTETAAQYPDREAVVCGSDRLTYRALDDRSAQLARRLIADGLSPGDRVAIHLHKSVDLGVAIYGILRAGGCFVPIDPAGPAARVQAIVADCDVQAVVTEAKLVSHLGEVVAPSSLIVVDDRFGTEQIDGALESLPTVAPDDLAYIMYTSGSTGPPKGMMHTHRSCLGFAGWGVETCDLVGSDRIANFSPLHFDISVFDFFSTVLAGGTVVLVPEHLLAFPANVTALLASEAITVLFTVPFALTQIARRGVLASRDLDALRWVLFGGEPFHPGALAELMNALPQARFANVYGPAEAPACVVHEVTTPPADNTPIPIGTLAANTHALLHEPGTAIPASPGEPAELLIRAPSITLGYWRRDDLNGRCYHDDAAGRWFRTGDLVIRDDGGVFTFLGRGDRMVKTRGFRVELDEVEAAIGSSAAVDQAATFASTVDGVTLVHAAIVPTARDDFDENDLFAELRDKLPGYALPVDVRVLDRLPRTTSDKADRRQLAADATADRRRR